MERAREWLPRLMIGCLLLGLAGLAGLPAPAPAAARAPAAPSAPAAAPAGGAEQQMTVVRFGSPQTVADAGIFIARARGYFRELGLDVDSLPFQSGPDTIPALAAGELEAAGGNLSVATLNAVERGIGLKMVADKGTSRPGFEYSQIVLRADLLGGEVRDAADLRGRRIGLASLRSGSESHVAQTLARGGLSIDDVELTPLGYPEMVVALSNRAIDAANINEPSMSAAVARGVAAHWPPGYGSTAFGGAYQGATLVISSRFAQQADVAHRFLIGYLRGVRAYNDAFVKGENRPEIVRLLTETTAIRDPATYDRMQMPGLDPDGRIGRQSLQLDMDYFRQKGYYTGPVTLDALVDPSYAEFAVGQLGPYR